LGRTRAPDDELAALYAQRAWEIESIFNELKPYQRGPRVILRSRTPEGVFQEAWGYRPVRQRDLAGALRRATRGGPPPQGPRRPARPRWESAPFLLSLLSVGE